MKDSADFKQDFCLVHSGCRRVFCGSSEGALTFVAQQAPAVPSAKAADGTRNVFFHNGAFHTLDDVLHFYAERDLNPAKWRPRRPGSEIDSPEFEPGPGKFEVGRPNSRLSAKIWGAWPQTQNPPLKFQFVSPHLSLELEVRADGPEFELERPSLWPTIWGGRLEFGLGGFDSRPNAQVRVSALEVSIVGRNSQHGVPRLKGYPRGNKLG